MLNRAVLILVLAAGALMAPRPALAQQTLNFHFGYFVPRGEDARVDEDILVSDRTFLAFDLKDFNGPSLGAEWLIPIGNYVEAGAGIDVYRRTVTSVYSELTHQDDSEIERDMKLRVIPLSFTFRVLPLGQRSAVQPYFGGGIGVFAWRYSETGEFVDFTRNGAIVRGAFVGSGNETGPIAFGGIRFGGNSVSAGFEARYQSASADLGSEFNAAGFTPTIDLGGWTYQATVGIRFGR